MPWKAIWLLVLLSSALLDGFIWWLYMIDPIKNWVLIYVGGVLGAAFGITAILLLIEKGN